MWLRVQLCVLRALCQSMQRLLGSHCSYDDTEIDGPSAKTSAVRRLLHINIHRGSSAHKKWINKLPVGALCEDWRFILRRFRKIGKLIPSSWPSSDGPARCLPPFFHLILSQPHGWTDHACCLNVALAMTSQTDAIVDRPAGRIACKNGHVTCLNVGRRHNRDILYRLLWWLNIQCTFSRIEQFE